MRVTPQRSLSIAGVCLALVSTCVLSLPIQANAAQKTTNARPVGWHVLAGSAGHIAVDADGYVYAVDGASNQIDIYAPGVTNKEDPVRQISGGNTELAQPNGIALDSLGNILVSNLATGTVVWFDRSADGDVAPIKRLNAFDYGTSGIALDALDDLYAVNCSASIRVFAPTANDTDAPTREISAPDSLLKSCGVAIGTDGRVWATEEEHGIFVFAADADGPSAPVAHIADNGWMTYPGQLAIGANGWVYWADSESQSVLVFSQKAQGSAAPQYILQGPRTYFDSPYGLGVDRQGNVYVSDALSGDILAFQNFTPAVAPTVYPAPKAAINSITRQKAWAVVDFSLTPLTHARYDRVAYSIDGKAWVSWGLYAKSSQFIKGLPAHRTYSIRIRAHIEGGIWSQPSPAVEYSTQNSP